MNFGNLTRNKIVVRITTIHQSILLEILYYFKKKTTLIMGRKRMKWKRNREKKE